MTQRTRTILFISAVFLFLIISLVSVSYSQGYRFDFKKKKFVQTGGIFLKTKPPGADVFIDGKPRGKTNFLSGKLLIKNLMPRFHEIRVKKTNFFSWQKSLEVKEKEVTEAKNILLIPKNPKPRLLIKGIKDFHPLSDGSGIVLFDEDKKKRILHFPDLISPPTTTATSSISQNASSSLEKFNNNVYRLDKDGYLFKNEEKLTTRTFNNFKVSPDEKRVVLWTNYEIYLLSLSPKMTYQGKTFELSFLTRFSKKIGQVFWLTPNYIIFRVGKDIKISETDTRDHLNIVRLFHFPQGETKIFFNQANKDLYILNQKNLFLVNIL